MNILELNAFEDYDKVAIDMRACVGKNTGIDKSQRDESIYMGFKSVVNKIFKSIKKHELVIDEVIYPYLYCCRHAIELGLKQNIKYILKLHSIKNIRLEVEKCLYGHNLKLLVDYLFRLARIDRRLFEPLEEVKDSIDALLVELYMDKRGDMFKYTISSRKKENFKKNGIVAVNIIQHKFVCITNILEEITRIVYVLVSEYFVGTYTNNLSRSDIEDIAQMLPPLNEFPTQKFADIKKEITTKYAISNTEFSKAVNIIKTHREFAQYINNEQKFGDLQEEDFKNLVLAMKEYAQIDKNIKSDDMGVIAFEDIPYTREINPAYKYASKISNDNLKVLMSFIEVSMNGYYSEQLDDLYNRLDFVEVDDYVINKCCYNSYKKLIKGFKKCGQLTYIKWLNKYYNEKEEMV